MLPWFLGPLPCFSQVLHCWQLSSIVSILVCIGKVIIPGFVVSADFCFHKFPGNWYLCWSEFDGHLVSFQVFCSPSLVILVDVAVNQSFYPGWPLLMWSYYCRNLEIYNNRILINNYFCQTLHTLMF